MFFVRKKSKGRYIKLEVIGAKNLRVPSTCVIVESTRRWKSAIGVLSSILPHWVQAFALSSPASQRPSQSDYPVPGFQLPLGAIFHMLGICNIHKSRRYCEGSLTHSHHYMVTDLRHCVSLSAASRHHFDLFLTSQSCV